MNQEYSKIKVFKITENTFFADCDNVVTAKRFALVHGCTIHEEQWLNRSGATRVHYWIHDENNNIVGLIQPIRDGWGFQIRTSIISETDLGTMSRLLNNN